MAPKCVTTGWTTSPLPTVLTRRWLYHSKRQISNGVTGSPTKATKASALSRLSTKTLLRSLALTSVMTSGWLLRPSLAFLGLVTRSKSGLLNPDRNRILNLLFRWTIYNHFCAGTNNTEILKTISDMRNMGYHGIILTYSKEIVLDHIQQEDPAKTTDYNQEHYDVVNEWKKGTLETLRMIGPSDILAVKLTGAGKIAIDAMKARQAMPKIIESALDEICLETSNKGARLWLDAEQQELQPGLDEWAIELMRKYNNNGHILVYNTIQAYLKGSKANIDRFITMAAQEGWGLGIKLVRGAYIDHEIRSLIHDTKEDTDRSYDLIANTLISQKLPAGAEHLTFLSTALFLATHNAASARKVIHDHRNRLSSGLPTVILECGQIQGMADELSCELLQNYDKCLQEPSIDRETIPRVFKCLTWGSVGECLGYLHRRAIENRGAVERCHHMTAALKQELRHRLFK